MPSFMGKAWYPLEGRVRVCLRRRLIFYKSQRCRLPPRFFLVFLFIYYNGPVEIDAIFDWMFEGDHDGGPLQGHKHVDVYCCMMNRALKKIDLSVRATRQGWREVVQV